MSDLVERLRLKMNCERTLTFWDSWRRYIADGGGGTWPRESFESVLDAADEDREEAADTIERLIRERDEARAELAEAHKYAERLATLLCEKHFKDVAPRWQPLPDTVGIITQIDNMTCGIEEKAEAAGYRRGVEDAAKVAKTHGVYPHLNVYAGGPEWYQHGQKIAAAILALLEQTSEPGEKK